MPAGIDNPALGYAAFAAVKLTGYTIAAIGISRAYRRVDRNPLLVGGARTGIGLVAGAAYGAFAWATGLFGSTGVAGYLAGLLPVRLAEWWLLVWLFYDRHLARPRRGWVVVVLGTLCSYLLDVPAVIGFVYTAGVWIC
jgi:hypothetical protein